MKLYLLLIDVMLFETKKPWCCSFFYDFFLMTILKRTRPLYSKDDEDYIDEGKQNEEEEEDVEEEEGNVKQYEELPFHYVLIKNLSALLSSQLSRTRKKCHICERCLQVFYTSKRLKDHEKYCSLMKICKTKLPKPGAQVYFKDYKKQLRQPFVLYADFEAIIKPENNNNSNIVSSHEAFSVGYFQKCEFDDKQTKYMDLAKFNYIAKNKYPPSVKPANLELNVDHMISGLRTVHTKYGDKVVADLEYADIGKKTMFLPNHLSATLQKNEEFFDELCEAAQKYQLFCRHHGNGILELKNPEVHAIRCLLAMRSRHRVQIRHRQYFAISLIAYQSPRLSALGATGSLIGGAAGVAKAINQVKAARNELAEMKRHNRSMEAVSIGKAPYAWKKLSRKYQRYNLNRELTHHGLEWDSARRLAPTAPPPAAAAQMGYRTPWVAARSAAVSALKASSCSRGCFQFRCASAVHKAALYSSKKKKRKRKNRAVAANAPRRAREKNPQRSEPSLRQSVCIMSRVSKILLLLLVMTISLNVSVAQEYEEGHCRRCSCDGPNANLVFDQHSYDKESYVQVVCSTHFPHEGLTLCKASNVKLELSNVGEKEKSKKECSLLVETGRKPLKPDAMKLLRFGEDKAILSWQIQPEHERSNMTGSWLLSVLHFEGCRQYRPDSVRTTNYTAASIVVYDNTFDVVVSSLEPDSPCAIPASGLNVPRCRFSFNDQAEPTSAKPSFWFHQIARDDDMILTPLEPRSPGSGHLLIDTFVPNDGTNRSRTRASIVQPDGTVLPLRVYTVSGYYQADPHDGVAYSTANGLIGICTESNDDEFTCSQFDRQGRPTLEVTFSFPHWTWHEFAVTNRASELGAGMLMLRYQCVDMRYNCYSQKGAHTAIQKIERDGSVKDMIYEPYRTYSCDRSRYRAGAQLWEHSPPGQICFTQVCHNKPKKTETSGISRVVLYVTNPAVEDINGITRARLLYSTRCSAPKEHNTPHKLGSEKKIGSPLEKKLKKKEGLKYFNIEKFSSLLSATSLRTSTRSSAGSPPASIHRAAAKRDDVAIWKLGKRVSAAAVYTHERARQRRQRIYISEAGGDPLFSRLFSPLRAFVHGSPRTGVSTAKSHQCAIKHNKPQSRCHTPYTIPRN
ncbi:unnamed protein product [Trichogramma brassicae]|uniref:C2H2-type domain-containing protein n=1 Tax=Trichogramma brassicae TaxID=86971 RepID=A0A6H5HZY7_9HYME|nr:unnamed protein product [Trichogramma brassicae]